MHERKDFKEQPGSQTAMALILAHNAVGKVITSQLGDNQHWEFLLKQLVDPSHVRPVAALEPGVDRAKIYDAAIGAWFRRKIDAKEPRGRPKDTPYTKKTAVSLLPTNGKMKFFTMVTSPVGILFDITQCSLKEKYIFLDNMATNKRWWLEGQPDSINARNYRACSLEDIRRFHETSQEKKFIPEWNEILLRLSRASVTAIFATKDALFDRINAIHKKFLTDAFLERNLPLMIISAETGAIVYSIQQQAADISQALKQLSNTPEYQLASTLPFDQIVRTNALLTDLLRSGPAAPIMPSQFKVAIAIREQKYDIAARILGEGKFTENEIETLSDRVLEAKVDYKHILESPLGLFFLKNTGCFLAEMITRFHIPLAEVIPFIKKYIFVLSPDQICNVIIILFKEHQSDFILWILRQRPNIPLNWCERATGNTPLHFAVIESKEDFRILDCLFQNAALFISKYNEQRKTPLTLAMGLHKFTLVEFLLKKFSAKFHPDELGNTFHDLLHLKKYTLAKLLLRKRPDATPITCQATQNSAFHLVSTDEKPDMELLSVLAEWDPAGFQFKNTFNQTALLMSLDREDFFQQLILQFGRSFSADHRGEALNALIAQKKFSQALWLLEKRRDTSLNIADARGNKALHLLAAAESKEEKNDEKKEEKAQSIKPISDNLKYQLLDLLVELGAKLDEPNLARKTPLTLLFEQHAAGAIEFLVDHWLEKFSSAQLSQLLLNIVRYFNADQANALKRKLLENKPELQVDVVDPKAKFSFFSILSDDFISAEDLATFSPRDILLVGVLNQLEATLTKPEMVASGKIIFDFLNVIRQLPGWVHVADYIDNADNYALLHKNSSTIYEKKRFGIGDDRIQPPSKEQQQAWLAFQTSASHPLGAPVYTFWERGQHLYSELLLLLQAAIFSWNAVMPELAQQAVERVIEITKYDIIRPYDAIPSHGMENIVSIVIGNRSWQERASAFMNDTDKKITSMTGENQAKFDAYRVYCRGGVNWPHAFETRRKAEKQGWTCRPTVRNRDRLQCDVCKKEVTGIMKWRRLITLHDMALHAAAMVTPASWAAAAATVTSVAAAAASAVATPVAAAAASAVITPVAAVAPSVVAAPAVAVAASAVATPAVAVSAATAIATHFGASAAAASAAPARAMPTHASASAAALVVLSPAEVAAAAASAAVTSRVLFPTPVPAATESTLRLGP